ncbi:chemotaxis protein [Pseudomonas sp. NZIPFR-PS5]|nr:chemotaxis protein [Pseudomonas sp. NZIPFR-PS5]
MSDTTTQTARLTSLTGLLIPLSDRHLLLPNVAVAELIDYQDSVADPAAPQWYLGPINWRNRSLPLLSFEAACGSLKFIALLTQGIPRSCKLDSQLSYVDVPLAELELAAVQVGETVAKIPDLVALEEWLVEAGLVQMTPSL